MPVLFELQDGVGWLTLARPHRHNAIDATMKTDLEKAVAELVSGEAAQQLRAVVVCGAGASFCSGADLDALKSFSPTQARQFMFDAATAFRKLEQLPVPVIAAVKGWCLGGGLELLLHCDLAIAAQDAVFGFPEVTLGLTTTAGAVTRLLAAVGTTRARQLLLTGQRFDAAQAHHAGLVSTVCPVEDFELVVRDFANRLAGYPVAGMRAMKRLIGTPLHSAFAAGWAAELAAFEALLASRATSFDRGPR